MTVLKPTKLAMTSWAIYIKPKTYLLGQSQRLSGHLGIGKPLIHHWVAESTYI